MSPALLRIVISRNLTGSGDTTDLEQLDNLRRAVRYPRVPSENQPPTPDTASPSSATPTTPIAQLELWEADLTALLRMGKTGVQTDLGREKAQEFADRLGAVRLPETHFVGSSDRRDRQLTTKISTKRGNSMRVTCESCVARSTSFPPRSYSRQRLMNVGPCHLQAVVFRIYTKRHSMDGVLQ